MGDLRALILDYGNVLSREQPADWYDTVARHLDASAADVHAGYWRHRADYDRVVILYGTVPLLVGVPQVTAVYRHLGVANYIATQRCIFVAWHSREA